jgi:hypothetical protein
MFATCGARQVKGFRDARAEWARSATMEVSVQKIPTSAAAKLDFVDFVAANTVVTLIFVAKLVKIPEFTAAVAAYRSELTLGYCGFFCWRAVHNMYWQVAEEPLLDYLRVAAYCNDLPAHDKRHIDLDYRYAERFPALFHVENFPDGPQRSIYAATLLAEMGSFAPRHEFRTAGFPTVKQYDEDEYIAYLKRPD